MGSILEKTVILMMVTILLLPQSVFAHASLVEAYPAFDARLDKSPDQVILKLYGHV